MPLLFIVLSIVFAHYSDNSAESACAFASGLLLMFAVQAAKE